MTMRSAGLRRASGAAVLALSLVVLGACSDDDEPRAAASTPAAAAPTTTEAAPVLTTTPPATTATTAATSSSEVASGESTPPASTHAPEGADPADPAELQSAIDAYDAAYAAATAAPGDPSHVDFLAATTDGELRQGVQAAIADRRAEGEALRPGPSGIVLDQRIDTVESVSGQEAVVVACLFNGSERYVVESGEVLDDSQVTWPNRVVLRRGDDGRWRVDAGARAGESQAVEANPCL